MKLLIMQFSAPSRHFISLRPKYSPQHPVLRHPQCMSLPLCSDKSTLKNSLIWDRTCSLITVPTELSGLQLLFAYSYGSGVNLLVRLSFYRSCFFIYHRMLYINYEGPLTSKFISLAGSTDSKSRETKR
jgi:hypothetical protein